MGKQLVLTMIGQCPLSSDGSKVAVGARYNDGNGNEAGHADF